jgi:hypothetical protein
MLIANSVIIGAIKLGSESEPLSKVLACAGLALCAALALMQWQGWRFFHILADNAKHFSVNYPINPFTDFPTTFGEEIIFYCAMSAIVIFSLIYIWILFNWRRRAG